MKATILFICHGNICRSPMAEFVMKHLVALQGRGADFQIASAATSREELGSDIHPGTRRILVREGIPFSPRRAVQIRPQDYDKWDYLIGMDEENRLGMLRIFGGDPRQKVHLLLEYAKKGRDIADPWYTGNFDDTYRDIREGCDALLEHITKQAAP